jgi:uncharacterized cupredoxin-like copper-binding protein
MTQLLTGARSAWLGIVVLAGLALAGCGSSSDSSSSASGPSSAAKTSSTPAAAGSEQVKLEADEDGGFYFNPRKGLKAKAGQATLVMTNPKTSGLPHGIAIEGQGLDKDGVTVQPGGVSRVTVTLKPGKYTYYCPVDSHKQKGMKGTLVVS